MWLLPPLSFRLIPYFLSPFLIFSLILYGQLTSHCPNKWPLLNYLQLFRSLGLVLTILLLGTLSSTLSKLFLVFSLDSVFYRKLFLSSEFGWGGTSQDSCTPCAFLITDRQGSTFSFSSFYDPSQHSTIPSRDNGEWGGERLEEEGVFGKLQAFWFGFLMPPLFYQRKAYHFLSINC